MSHTESIRNILNLKDSNITFSNFFSEEKIKGVESKVFHGKLSYEPLGCYHCGVTFDDLIIKYGFKTSQIKLPNVSGFNTYLRL